MIHAHLSISIHEFTVGCRSRVCESQGKVFYILFLKIFLDPFRNIFWISVKDKTPIMLQLHISNGHFQADIQYFIIILFFHYTIDFYKVSCSFYIETALKDISSCMFSCRNGDLCCENAITLYPKCSNFV